MSVWCSMTSDLYWAGPGASRRARPLVLSFLCVIPLIMQMSKRKRRGRPATGKTPIRAIRLTDEFMDKIDHWATQQEDQPGRSEAIRRLVERGLKASRHSG